MPAARRTALLALLVIATALAGCSALPDTEPGTNDSAGTATPLPVGTPTPTATPTPTPHSDPVRYSIGEQNLGEHEEPHGIRLVNARNETTVHVTLHITHEDAEAIHETTSSLSPDEAQYGVLTSKANYTVTVTVGNQNGTETIPASMFDCNDSTTTFTIEATDISVQTLSTTMGCPTASSE